MIMKILNETELKEVSGGGMWDGANGYAYRDANGGWHYKVTKTPAQATVDVVVNSWANGAAGGFGL